MRKVGYRYTDGQTWVHRTSSAGVGPKNKECNVVEFLGCFLETSLSGETTATMPLKKIKTKL